LCSEGKEIISGIEMEAVFAKLAEDPRGIVLKLEVVFGRRR
jgi:hypothetical protein